MTFLAESMIPTAEMRVYFPQLCVRVCGLRPTGSAGRRQLNVGACKCRSVCGRETFMCKC